MGPLRGAAGPELRWAPPVARAMAAEAWEAPVAKFLARADVLAGAGLSWAMRGAQWNTYLTPVLGYVAQAYALPPPARQAVQRAAARVSRTSG